MGDHDYIMDHGSRLIKPDFIWIASGHYGTIAAFRYEAEAIKAAACKGEWGSDGSVRMLELYDSYAEYKEDDKRKAIESAKAKLTPEERRLLGLG